MDRWGQSLKMSRNTEEKGVADHLCEGDNLIEPKFMEMTEEL